MSNALVWDPLAVSRRNRVLAAKSGSWCTGFGSPAARAKAATSAGVRVTSAENLSRG